MSGDYVTAERLTQLERELAVYRAMEQALRALVESHDHGGHNNSPTSYTHISPGELAEILNLAARALGER